MSNPRGKAGKWGPTTTTARGKRKQLSEALLMGTLMQRQREAQAEREQLRRTAAAFRADAVFDCYAGLRKLTFTREGALAKLKAIGVGPEEALTAAERYEPRPTPAAVTTGEATSCTGCGQHVSLTEDWTLWPWGDGAALCNACNDKRHEKEEYR